MSTVGLAEHCGVVMRRIGGWHTMVLRTHAAKQHGRRSKSLHGECSHQEPSEKNAKPEHIV
ncbi:MAG: hypothetical protein H7274_16890 [Rhodoferax sp.]|nr:hypothetical protein [Rhodoferax sp.]